MQLDLFFALFKLAQAKSVKYYPGVTFVKALQATDSNRYITLVITSKQIRDRTLVQKTRVERAHLSNYSLRFHEKNDNFEANFNIRRITNPIAKINERLVPYLLVKINMYVHVKYI